MTASRRTFIVVSDDWGRHVSTSQHLFQRVRQHADVIWINALGHREPSFNWTDAKRIWEKLGTMVAGGRATTTSRVPDTMSPGDPRAGQSPAPIITHPDNDVGIGLRPARTRENPIVIHPRVLPFHSRAWVRRVNKWSLRRDIQKALHALGDPSDVVFVIASPPATMLIGTLGERADIYFVMDDFLELPGTSPQMIKPLEEEVLANVDAVIATAAALVKKKRCHTGRGYQLPQGVNFEHFATPRPEPADLAALPHPRIGFAGGVGAALDVPTMLALADAFPHGTIVLVGPMYLPPGTFDRPNIVSLGPRPYAELPAYVQAFDVGIIPYVENDWTRSVDPLKLLEYLGAGIPVVASPLPEVHKYADVVQIAPLGSAFVDAVRESLRPVSAEVRAARVACAKANTWERRADQFLAIVDEVVTAVS